MNIETFFTISEQAELFLLSVALGAVMGIIFDIFRVIRIIFPPAKKTGAVCLLDIIFWLMFGFALFLYSVVMGRGQVRVIYFIGSMTGFVLYIVSIGNIITGLIRRISDAINKKLQKVYSFIIAPIVNLCVFIRQKISLVFVRSHKVLKKAK